MAAAPFRALLDTTPSRPDSAIVVKCLCNFLTFLSRWIAKMIYLHSYNNDKKTNGIFRVRRINVYTFILYAL